MTEIITLDLKVVWEVIMLSLISDLYGNDVIKPKNFASNFKLDKQVIKFNLVCSSTLVSILHKKIS